MARIIQFPKLPGSEAVDNLGRDFSPKPEHQEGKLSSEDYLYFLKIITPCIAQTGRGRKIRSSLDYNRLVVDYSDEELLGWLDKSHEFEWPTRPMFFYRINKEIVRRGLVPKL